jgi:hypothetical protein
VKYLVNDGTTANYAGNLTDVFSCMTNIGQSGCGFEHQFESIRVALQRAENPSDPDNGGFLRPEAFLGIVMLTNEDDCSVPAPSQLFDPGQQTLADPRGGLNSYRCNEFGHLCNGGAPPHTPPATPVALDNCTSNEDGPLVSVEGFASFLKGLKTDPSRIFIAALAGAPTPYVVGGHTFMLGNGASEVQPLIQHSCSASAGDYADPGVRIAQLLRSFGPNAVFESICADDFMPAMQNIGNAMVGMMAP